MAHSRKWLIYRIPVTFLMLLALPFAWLLISSLLFDLLPIMNEHFGSPFRTSHLEKFIKFPILLISLGFSSCYFCRHSFYSIRLIIKGISKSDLNFESEDILVPFIFPAMSAPVSLFGVFPVLMRDINAFWPELFFKAKEHLFYANFPKNDSISSFLGFDWMMFSLDQTARAVLLDFFETFHIKLAPISYNPGLAIPTLIFFYKTILAFSFCRWMFIIYRNWND